MTDGDVPVDGEREHENLGEILRYEVETEEHLTDDRQVLELNVEAAPDDDVERVEDQKDDAVDAQRRDVDGRRLVTTHSTLEPDGCRQTVTDQSDDYQQVADDGRKLDGVWDETLQQQRARVSPKYRHHGVGRRRNYIRQ